MSSSKERCVECRRLIAVVDKPAPYVILRSHICKDDMGLPVKSRGTAESKYRHLTGHTEGLRLVDQGYQMRPMGVSR